MVAFACIRISAFFSVYKQPHLIECLVKSGRTEKIYWIWVRTYGPCCAWSARPDLEQ